LASSAHYRVLRDYEIVFLETPHRSRVVIGDFYGDTCTALIDTNERWCLKAGCGLILYFLREPFQPYTYDTHTTQWIEWYRHPKDTWYVETLEQTAPECVRFTVDPYSEHAGSYNVHILTCIITRINT
jgi:hypothetical protein